MDAVEVLKALESTFGVPLIRSSFVGLYARASIQLDGVLKVYTLAIESPYRNAF